MVLFCTEVNRQAAGSTGTPLRPSTVRLERKQQRAPHLAHFDLADCHSSPLQALFSNVLTPPTVCLEQQQQRAWHLEQHVADLLGVLGCAALQQLAVL